MITEDMARKLLEMDKPMNEDDKPQIELPSSAPEDQSAGIEAKRSRARQAFGIVQRLAEVATIGGLREARLVAGALEALGEVVEERRDAKELEQAKAEALKARQALTAELRIGERRKERIDGLGRELESKVAQLHESNRQLIEARQELKLSESMADERMAALVSERDDLAKRIGELEEYIGELRQRVGPRYPSDLQEEPAQDPDVQA